MRERSDEAPVSALAETELHPFLRRARRRAGDLPELGRWLAQTLALAGRFVASDAGAVLLDSPETKRREGRSPLTFVATFGEAGSRVLGDTIPPGEGIVGRVYGHGCAERVADAAADPDDFSGAGAPPGPRSLLAAPVRLEDQVCGVLALMRRGEEPFGAHDLELAEVFAAHVGRAILNAVDLLKQNELAQRDELTGLYNVRGLEPHLADEVEAAQAEGHDVALLFVDVDRLKQLNDKLGHRAGSEALRRVGRAIREATGDAGRAYRFGGDEFVVVARRDADAARALAEALRTHVRSLSQGPMEHGGTLPAIELSVGVATLAGLRPQRRDASHAARLMAAADRALYRAKGGGRARVVLAAPPDDALGAPDAAESSTD